MRIVQLVSTTVVAVLLLPVAVAARNEGAALAPTPAKLSSPLFEGNPALAKASTDLLRSRRLLRQGVALPHVRSNLVRVPFADRRIELDVTLETFTPEILRRVRAAGMRSIRAYPEWGRITGFLDPAQLDELGAIPEVTAIRPNYRPIRRVGSTTSQADSSIRAERARETFGVDGSGIGVGVVSDSVHDVIGGTISGAGCGRILTDSEPQRSGDLPNGVVILDDGPGGGSDEGAAMAELVHDLAPGAPLLFHTGFRGEADFADGIGDLRNCGARVIVDDLLYFAEPMFQDGLVAQAAQAAVDAGVAYFSAAGNDSRFGVYEVFKDSNGADDSLFPPTGRDFHDFGAGDRFASITIPSGCDVVLVLQWNEPFSGLLGPGASSDLDLHVCSGTSPGSCRFGSVSAQGCGAGSSGPRGDPFEIAGVRNDLSTDRMIQVAVDHYCGNENVRFRISTFTGCSTDGYRFEGDVFRRFQIYGHSAARGAVAVAASFYAEIDSDGRLEPPAAQIDTEPFSSRGGRIPFFFDGRGRRLAGAPERRFKPELTAPDGTNTSFFGQDADGDGFPNFFGTSAAAPHAAAVAALMLEANPKLSPAELVHVMRSTAIDIEKNGRDAHAGDGLVDALGAVGAAIE